MFLLMLIIGYSILAATPVCFFHKNGVNSPVDGGLVYWLQVA